MKPSDIHRSLSCFHYLLTCIKEIYSEKRCICCVFIRAYSIKKYGLSKISNNQYYIETKFSRKKIKERRRYYFPSCILFDGQFFTTKGSFTRATCLKNSCNFDFSYSSSVLLQLVVIVYFSRCILTLNNAPPELSWVSCLVFIYFIIDLSPAYVRLYS